MEYKAIDKKGVENTWFLHEMKNDKGVVYRRFFSKSKEHKLKNGTVLPEVELPKGYIVKMSRTKDGKGGFPLASNPANEQRNKERKELRAKLRHERSAKRKVRRLARSGKVRFAKAKPKLLERYKKLHLKLSKKRVRMLASIKAEHKNLEVEKKAKISALAKKLNVVYKPRTPKVAQKVENTVKK